MRRLLPLPAATLATAVLLVLAMPPSRFGVLGWVAFVPVFAVARRPVSGLVAAVIACVGMGVLAESGLVHDLSVERGDPRWSWLASLEFGVVAGVVATAWCAIREPRARDAWVVAAFAVVVEAATLLILPAHLALTQAREPFVVGLSSWTGIWGASYVVWLVNLLVALEFRRLVAGQLQGAEVGSVAGLAPDSRCVGVGSSGGATTPSVTASQPAAWRDSAWRRAGAVAGVTAALLVAGRLAASPPETGRLRVGLLQSDTLSAKGIARRNAEAGAAGAELVVWPELAGMSSVRGGDASALVALAADPSQPPFITSFQSGDRPMPKNVAAVFSRDGESRRYAKRRPFAGERMTHAPGDEPVAVRVRLPSGDVTAGVMICFDACFPSLVRETAALPGVDLILLPTLDPDTPSGFVQAVHAAFTPFRASENGLPILRTDLTAYSHAVDARGRILAEAGSGSDEVVVTSIAPGRRWTLYSVVGDAFAWVCGAVVAAAAAAAAWRSAVTSRARARR